MSYSSVRNKKGISEKRAHFATAGMLSDVTESAGTSDFGGGSFFGEFAEVPENGFAISLNMAPNGLALETRKSHVIHRLQNAISLVRVYDRLYGIGADGFYPIGNASVSADGEGKFYINCDYSGGNTAPGAYVSNYLPAGRYAFRLYTADVCPNIRIYENISNVQFNGMPEIKRDRDGREYIQKEFTAEEYIRIEITFPSGESGTYEIGRPMIWDIGTPCAKGVAEEDAESAFFEGESAVLCGTAGIENAENDAEIFADGKYVFKRGRYLYSYTPQNGECFLECDSLPESGDCAIYKCGGGFTVICENGKIVTIDSFSPCYGVKESEIYTPMHYTIYGRESGKEAKKEEELNLLNEYFYVTLFLEENASAVLPEELCVDTEFLEVYTPYGMEPYPEGTAIIEKGEGGTVITNKGGELGMVAKLRICGECPAGQKTKRLRSLLLTPCGSEIFPAAYGKGHNAVLYGGENGAEFAVCSLDGDLYVKEGEVLLAQNTEKITSVLRYSENFLVFSPHYIRKMILTEAEDGSFNASMQNFKYDIGCNVPKSAVCADDKIIYANSHAGIFYIDRFGFTQKDMSRHVSANIEAGENGFFALSESDAKGAQAVVCGGKYFLCAGDFFYVWDFAHGLPSSTEKASEEQRLRWFMYSGIPCFKMLGADGENFYFLTSAGEFASLCHGTSLSSGAESYFRSRKYNLAQFGKACVWKLSISLASKSECTVRLYFDGEEGNSKYTVSPDSEASTLCIVRPEARACRSFAFSIHSFGAMRLDGVKIEFLPK